MFEMLYLAPVRMARLVTPVMQRQGKGAIVNISAMALKEAYDSYPTSSTIRRALDGFAKLHADRYARDGIRMNNLSPGVVATMEWSEEVRRAIPAQRIASPEEIAGIVAFLLSDEAAYITGQNIVADGGLNRSN
jgi:NAD(P)-dependent dehydrogenase (short-subunit alcohol dehydrogenase family)